MLFIHLQCQLENLRYKENEQELIDENNKLRTQVRNLTQGRKNAQVIMTAKRQTLRERLNQITDLKHQVKTAAKQSEELQQAREELISQRKKKKDLKKQYIKKIEEAQQTIEELEQKCDELANTNTQATTEDVEKMQTELEDKIQHIQVPYIFLLLP